MYILVDWDLHSFVVISHLVMSVSPYCVCSADKHSRPKALKTEEEQLLRAFYEFKIQDVCDAFKFPRKIQVTISLGSVLSKDYR